MLTPGTYTTCYEITNSSKNTATGCSKVNVIKAPSKKRFVSKFTVHDTILKRWKRIELQKRLTSNLSILIERIRP